jgi:hypothetical protein
MLFVPLVYWSFSFIGIGKLPIPKLWAIANPQSSHLQVRQSTVPSTGTPPRSLTDGTTVPVLSSALLPCKLEAPLCFEVKADSIYSGLATLGTNISTNSIAASNDLAFLFPRWLNIKRGAFITSFLGGWVTCPWQIQKSAQSLTTFLSGYVIVLAPLLSIMVSFTSFFGQISADG